MIDGIYPRVDRDSGSVDALNFIRIFQKLGFLPVFCAHAEFDEASPYRNALEDEGVYCIGPETFASIEHFLEENGEGIDIAFLSRIEHGGRFVEKVRAACPEAKIIFNAVDLHHLRLEREGHLLRKRRLLEKARLTREREIAAARRSDLTVVVSHEERRILSEAAPGARVVLVPLIRTIPGRTRGLEGRLDIGFIGGFSHRPNVDAVAYFLDEIWPKVRDRLPGVRFLAIGADMPAHLAERQEPGFVAAGHIADLSQVMSALRLTVAPLRYGAGAKGKIVTSLGYGVPCVATSVAAEGMGLTDGTNIAVGDTPAEFAERIIGLYHDEALWRHLSEEGLSFAMKEHSFERGLERLEDALRAIAAVPPRGRQGHAFAGEGTVGSSGESGDTPLSSARNARE